MSEPYVSAVVPFLNEEASAAFVVHELAAALGSLSHSFEIILVDDGSTDGTCERLLALAAGHRECRVLRHSATSGQASALLTGLRVARGQILVTLDGDGQNDPADLAMMFERLASADLVLGRRTQRRDSALRRVMSVVANAVRRRMLDDHAHDAGCALRVFRRPVGDSFIPIRTLYSFIPACSSAAGYRIAECDVRHRPRSHGRSSYGLRMMFWRPALDMLALAWLKRRHIGPAEVQELTTGLLTRSRSVPLHAPGRTPGGCSVPM